MGYKDQLILTGELDDVGAIRKIVETVIVLDLTLLLRSRTKNIVLIRTRIFFTRDGVLTALGIQILRILQI
jgi:hypothetical protein